MLQAQMAMIRKAISYLGTATARLTKFSRKLPPLSTFLKQLATINGILLIMGSVCITGTVIGLNWSPARAEGGTVEQSARSLIDFEEGVRLALRQSPYFIKSALEIDISRMNETDSRYGLTPTVSFRTRYYVNRPTTQDVNVITSSANPPVVVNQSVVVPRAYSLEFYSDTYNPFEAYFSLQAHKLLTKIAIFAHIQVISEGIQRLGRMFLELETLKRSAEYQSAIIDLARKSLEYMENRAGLGTATSLEVRVAKQELELAQAEKVRIESSQKRITENLKSFLGLKTSGELSLDLHDAGRQVLGNYDANTATLDQVKSRSLELKIQEIKKKLQEYNIIVAKTRLLPRFFGGVQTPDPLSLTAGGGRDFYFSVGLQVPVWDGFSRFRNISRQKAILKQYGAEKDLKEMDLGDVWEVVQGEINETGAALKLAQSQEELARLRERQTDIRYQSGSLQLPAYLEGRKAVLEARKATAIKAMNYRAAVLKLRLVSGDLGYSYVDQSSWQN